MSAIFADWNKGVLSSYLIEISAEILAHTQADGISTVDLILDTAGQKGTGKWTAVNALDEGIPLTLISEAVFSRFLSALKDERVIASQTLRGPQATFKGDKNALLQDIHDALYAAKIISYTQGYMLMRQAAAENSWQLDYGAIALMWREGCIIRSAFLGDIKAAYSLQPDLTNLLLNDYFKDAIASSQEGWRRLLAIAIIHGVPVPAMSSALSFYDGYRSARLPANLLQGQRDYFGAHTYERLDKPRGEMFHTNWTGHGGDVTSSSYNA
jgi:6-phosphogluconate dehydrogenase